jgi:signal transduction histidine kinase
MTDSNRGRKPSLAGRITLTYTFVLAFTLLALLGGFGLYLQWKAESDLKTEGRQVAAWMSAVVAEPLWNLDYGQLKIMTGGLVVHSSVDHITIFDPDNHTILEIGASAPGAPVFDEPIRRDDVVLGHLALTVANKALASDGLVSYGVILFVCLFAVLVLATPFLFRYWARAPLQELSNLVDRYARGEYRSLDQLHMPYREFDKIASALSSMGRTIREQMDRWRQLNDHLEIAVTARTQDLERTLVNLRRTQDSLVRSEKLASLGKLVAVFAHELNTPLGVITSSAQTLDGLSRDFAAILGQDQYLPPGLVAESLERARDLASFPTRAELREWKKARADMPPEAFETVSRLVEDYGLWPLRDQLQSLVDQGTPFKALRNLETLCTSARSVVLVTSAAQRAAGVVKALRVYLKDETEGNPSEVDLGAELDRILVLLGTKLRGGIQVVREYEPGLRAWGNTESLSQVWMNLVVNALYALDRKGTLTLRARALGDKAAVEIEDSGPGVPDEIRDRIFEPFFTTKREGEGMGLGLDICRQIVEAQGGTIGFESRPGRTVFRVELPVPSL